MADEREPALSRRIAAAEETPVRSALRLYEGEECCNSTWLSSRGQCISLVYGPIRTESPSHRHVVHRKLFLRRALLARVDSNRLRQYKARRLSISRNDA